MPQQCVGGQGSTLDLAKGGLTALPRTLVGFERGWFMVGNGRNRGEGRVRREGIRRAGKGEMGRKRMWG